MVDAMEREADAIKREAFRMSWFMRGGATYEQVLNMSINERNMIQALIKDNLETTKKSRLPFF